MKWIIGMAHAVHRAYDQEIPLVAGLAERWNRTAEQYDRIGWHVNVGGGHRWYYCDTESIQRAFGSAARAYVAAQLRPSRDTREDSIDDADDWRRPI